MPACRVCDHCKSDDGIMLVKIGGASCEYHFGTGLVLRLVSASRYHNSYIPSYTTHNCLTSRMYSHNHTLTKYVGNWK